MTQLTFKRTGTDHESEFTFDLDSLPGGEAQNLFHLIHEADFFRLPEQIGVAGALDEPQYVITIGYGNGKQHTVSVNDAAVSEALRPLIDELTALADAQSA
jgi:hypothetical protein